MKNEDTLKEAFENVKKDILKLQSNIESVNNFCFENESKINSLSFLFKELSLQYKETLLEQKNLISVLTSLSNSLFKMEDNLSNLSTKVDKINFPLETVVFEKNQGVSTTSTDNSTRNQGVSTTSTDILLENGLDKALGGDKPHNSTRNQGVSTDRQTIKQTDTPFSRSSYNPDFEVKTSSSQPILKNALNNLNSLEEIKSQLKAQFENLTPQEFLVFSTIYQLSLQDELTTYPFLSQKLNLTQSSIRDYVQRLILKGIPIEKIRKNNKNISLFLSKDFQKVVSLPSIFKIRHL
jgi:hypothetical protein